MSDTEIIIIVLGLLMRDGRVTPLSVTRSVTGDARVMRSSHKVRRIIDDMECAGIIVRSANAWFWCPGNDLESIIEKDSPNDIPF